jgi:hypothetical protein
MEMNILQIIAFICGVITYFAIRLLIEIVSDKIDKKRYLRDLKSGKARPYKHTYITTLSNNINSCKK